MPGYEDVVKAKLKEAGCSFYRQGKGDHEIWFSPITGKKFPVSGHQVPTHGERDHEAGRHRIQVSLIGQGNFETPWRNTLRGPRSNRSMVRVAGDAAVMGASTLSLMGERAAHGR